MDRPEIPVDISAIEALARDFPELGDAVPALIAAAASVVASLDAGGTLFLTGNGGSLADCLHIAGELKKSFEKPRPLAPALVEALTSLPAGQELAENLQAGLRAIVLGADPVLATAVDNDIDLRHIQFAQELVALGRSGDVLMAISTSGNAKNVRNCALVAAALGMVVVVLTGEADSPLSEMGDVVIRAPARATAQVQSWHSQLYHAFCRAVEDTLFA